MIPSPTSPPDLILHLPWPPSNNQIWRRVHQRVLLSRHARAYRSNVLAIVAAGRVQHFPGRVAFYMEAYPPDNRLRDLDNYLKATLDALEHAGVFANDAYVREIYARMHDRDATAWPNGGLRVRVQAIG